MTGPRIQGRTHDPLDEIFNDSAQAPQAGGSGDPLDEIFASDTQKPRVSMDQRQVRESTGVTPRTKQQNRNPQAGEGMLDRVLSGLTLGAHRPIVATGQAIGDVVMHGTGSHPIDTFRQSIADTQDREQQSKREHGLIGDAGEAIANIAPLALEAPIRGALGLRDAVEAASAPTAMRRIARAGAKGAATGAVVGGLGGADNVGEGVKKMATGGILGGLFGGGASAVAEVAPKASGTLRDLFQSGQAKAERTANRNILGGLSDDRIMPEDLPERGRAAVAAGNEHAVVSHLGDRGLDQQTYLATSANSPESADLARTLEHAQRSENEILQHGVTQMSGIPETAAAEPEALQRSLTNRRRALGAVDYPRAHAAPDVSDPRIANAIRGDRDLSGVLDEVVAQMNREEEAAAIRAGREPVPIAHPFAPAHGNALDGIDIGRLRRDYPDQADDIIQQLTSRNQQTPTISVQMLDRMKQGADDIVERGIDGRPMTARDARILRDKVNSILGFLDDQRPDYAHARSGQTALFGQADAAELGATALDRSGGEITNDLQGLQAPNEADAYLATATSDLRAGIKGARRNNNAQLKLDSPKVEEQLDALYGPGGRAQLQPSVEQARRVNEVRQRATGGSPTEARQASRAQTSNEATTEAVQALVSPQRAAFNFPAKWADAHQRKVQMAVYREMARRLGIAADDPRLDSFVQELIRTRSGLPFNSHRPAMNPALTRGTGVLAGYLGQKVGQ